MQYAWRGTLKKRLEEVYIQTHQEWFDMYFSTSGHIDLTIVSNQFAETSYTERRTSLQKLLSELRISLEIGMLYLYTPQEAETVGLTPSSAVVEREAYTWLDQAVVAANLEEGQIPSRREPRNPRTIAFYSFKGGVGRTTALTHIAWILAKRGRKVVAVDLDLEAPGLSSALELSPDAPYGIIDYFYSRAYGSEEQHISVADIFGEVSIPDASGRLFVVSAGKLNLDYLAQIEDLSTTITTRAGEDLWTTFFNDINQQVQPDIILVDSRTGLNKWGAFTLLRAADQAIVFLYPNEQNRKGIDLLLDALAGQIPLQFVFSPIYPNEAGLQLVKQCWSALQEHQKRFIVHNETLPEEDDIGLAEPITIYYQPEIALATNYPVVDLASHYMGVANIIDEENTITRREDILSHAQQRQKILESLEFPEVDAARTTGPSLGEIFQRTSDFDRFLDNGTCLIRGRKGTGKTALYQFFLKYEQEARQLANERLDDITLLSGHGEMQKARPTKGQFRTFHQKINENHSSWIDLWRAYLVLRLHQENQLPSMKDAKFQPLRKLLTTIPKGTDLWESEHTQTLVQITTTSTLSLYVQDLVGLLNRQLQKEQKILWLLYDELDVDLEREIREEALIGLFQLLQTLEAQNIRAIRFKIFLREDIWSRLIFDNKSHLNGRDITLLWTYRDFLGLALKQALRSTEFSELVNRFAPVGKIDQAETQTIEKALFLLWGIRRQPNEQSKYVSRWVYDRLTDAGKTSFPRSLNVLLRKARAYELENYRDNADLPSDRLLRLKSLNEGLIEASNERCGELKEEYPDLVPFFDSLVGCEIVVSQAKLRELWAGTIQRTLPEFQDFKKFVDFLISIGLIGVAEKREKEQGYRFAEIYTHGFRIYRGSRKY